MAGTSRRYVRPRTTPPSERRMTNRTQLQMIMIRQLREQAAEIKHGHATWQLLAKAADEIERLQHERDSIELELIQMAERVERLRPALRDLLKYGDDHNWGTIPEGATIERAREAVASS